MKNHLRLLEESECDNQNLDTQEEGSVRIGDVSPGSFVSLTKSGLPLMVTCNQHLELDNVVGVVFMNSYVFKWVGAGTKVLMP